MAEHWEYLGLEIGKHGPGRYTIEGWEVIKVAWNRWTAKRHADEPWLNARTLSEIKDQIWDHENERRSF